MTDDDKKKAVTSLPPPPTDEIDEDWGSRPSGTPPDPKDPKRDSAASAKKSSDSKNDLTPPWKKAKPVDEEEDDEDLEDEDEDEDDDDDLDDEDEEEDDEDEEEERRRKARARAKASHGSHAATSDRKSPPPPASDDWIPDWAPWAVLIALLGLGFVGGFGLLPWNFNLKKATPAVASAAPMAASSNARPSASALREQMRERRRKAAMAADGGADSAMIRASHLLVAYQGAMRSAQTRTKEEAKTRAEAALKRAKKGEDFAGLVKEYSDEPGAGDRGGDLNRFGRGRMVPAFEEAAFALKVNEISGLVETPFGYHVIKRTE